MPSTQHSQFNENAAGFSSAQSGVGAIRQGRVAAFLDLGSNSLRMMVVRISADGAWTLMNQVKHMVRLGEGSFEKRQLQEPAIARTLAVLESMAEMCRTYGVQERRAVATAAVRDAENSAEFIQRARERAGFDFTVISGREEARLIYLGVVSGLERALTKPHLFVDIGGGSTELIVGDSTCCRNLDSLKLGCVRLTNRFFQGSGPFSREHYEAVRRAVKNDALHGIQRAGVYELAGSVGSSGTIQNLGEICAVIEQQAGKNGSPSLINYSTLCEAAPRLCSLSLEQRRNVPGINPNRADVILAGAAILQTLMEELKLKSMIVSSRNLQNGLLEDYLQRSHPERYGGKLSTRDQSVLQLGQRCHFEEEHARRVSSLSLTLFDSARDLRLVTATPEERDLLHHAAMLHDVGIFVAFSNHHAHSHYLIRNAELLGFTEREIAVIAAAAFFHRKRPSRKYPIFDELLPADQKAVQNLSLFLTIAEKLDRSHCGLIDRAWFERDGSGALVLAFHCRGDCPLEMEELQKALKLLRKSLDEPISLLKLSDRELLGD